MTEPDPGMSAEQRLIPEPIYRLNAALEDLLNAYESLKGLHLQCALFDWRTQSFRWLAIHPKCWSLTDDLWRHLKEPLQSLDKVTLPKELRDHINSAVKAEFDLDGAARLHRDVLEVLGNLPLPKNRYLDGLVYRDICEVANERPAVFFQGELLWDRGDTYYRDCPGGAPWISARAYRRADKPDNERFYCQETGKFEENPTKPCTPPDRSPVVDLATGLMKHLGKLGEKPNRVFLVPIYDGSRASLSWGRLVGTVLVMVPESKMPSQAEETTKYLQQTASVVRNVLVPNTDRLRAALAAAAAAAVAKEPVKPDDRAGDSPALWHFLRCLPLFQDWARVAAIRNGKEKNERKTVCFSYDEGRNWKACKGNCGACNILTEKSEKFTPGGKYTLRAESEVLDMLPDRSWLSAEEARQLKGYRLAFEFPDYALLPSDEANYRRLCSAYFHEQSDIWGVVLPKVVLRGRAEINANRSAAAAIMSRNMSHNIGSHPVSALADTDELGKMRGRLGTPVITEFKTSEKTSDARLADFMRYVRERMDYIAEIATADPAWSTAYKLREIVTQFDDQTLLKLRLTELGSHDVTYIGDKRHQALMPHGLLGIQAFYSILENVIRNSERHGNSIPRQRATIRIMARDCGDCWQIEMFDKGTCRDVTVPTDKDAVAILRGLLELPFYSRSKTEDLDTLNRDAWGLREMKMSAAFLRLRPPHLADEYGDPEGTADYEQTAGAPWIEADWRLSPDDNEGPEYLCLALKLLKPKIAVIVRKKISGNNDCEERWKQHGVTFHSPETLEEYLQGRPGLPHRFLVSLDETWPEIEQLAPRLPVRVIRLSGNDCRPESKSIRDQILGSAEISPQQLQESLYGRWLSELTACAAMNYPQTLVVAEIGARSELHDVVALQDKGFSQGSPNNSEFCRGRPGRMVVYERHSEGDGGLYRCDRCWTSDDRCHEAHWKKVRAYIGHRQAFAPAALTALKSLLFSRQLIEAGLVWLIVFDERVSKRLKQDGGVTRRMLGRAGILTQRFKHDNVADIQAEEIGPQEAINLLNWGKTLLGGDELTGDPAGPAMLFISCHYSLLKTKPMGWVHGLREALGSLKIPVEVMLHSGKGNPPEFGKSELSGTKFLEFSNVEALLQHPSFKPMLVEILLSVRASNA